MDEIKLKKLISDYKSSHPKISNKTDKEIISIMCNDPKVKREDVAQLSMLLSNQTLQIGDSCSFSKASSPQVQTKSVVVKTQEGKNYNLNKTIELRINKITEKLSKQEKSNGFIGNAWSGFKNLTGIGDSSDKVRQFIEHERKLLSEFNSNTQKRPQIFKELTGMDYIPENLEKFIKGQIKLQSEIALDKYKEGQEMAVDITSDIVSGVVAYGTAAICIAGGIAAAPFTAGASLGAVAVGVGIAAGAGAATKVALKAGDAYTSGREYTLKEAGKDAVIGGVSGALAPVTMGAGGAVANTTAKVAPKFIANTARYSVEGAMFGAVDGGTRATLEGKTIEDIAVATGEGALGGAIVGNVMGHGGAGISKISKEVAKYLPFGKIPEHVPENVIPKKTLTDLYPESDVPEIALMKQRLQARANGVDDINLSELTAEPYKIKKEFTETKTEFSFDSEADNVAVGEQYKVIRTVDDGDYKIYKATQSGSNPGFWVEHSTSGDLFYFKTGNGQQNITEHVSSQLYKAAGIDAPEMNLVAAPGFYSSVGVDNCWIKSKAIAGLKPISENPKVAYEGFAVDAWLANWDAVCSGNTLIKNGTAVRVDFGGCLDFRARGERKAFGNVVSELSTLMDENINRESAAIFKNMTREDLISSLKRVQSVSNDEIQKIYNSVKIYMNPELFLTLQNRKTYLNYILKEAEALPMKPGQTIQEYVKALETKVSTKYKRQIATMNSAQEQRNRILREMEAQRDAVCSDKDLKAIWDYKGSSFTANTLIQRGKVNDSLVTSLDESLSKVSLPEDMVLYRGDHFITDMEVNLRYLGDCNIEGSVHLNKYKHTYYEDGSHKSSGIELSDGKVYKTILVDGKKIDVECPMEDLIKHIFQKGKIVEEQQFVSTTINPCVAKAFGPNPTDIIYKFKAPKGVKGTSPERIKPEITHGSAAHLTGGGGVEGTEAEVLLKRGFRYRMDNLLFDNGQYVIECTILL